MNTTLFAKNSGTQGGNAAQYMRLPLAVFRMHEIGSVDLYCMREHFDSPILYRSGNYPLSREDVDELERRGHQALYITLSSFAIIQKSLLQSLDKVVEYDQIPANERFAALQTAVALEMDLAFQLIRPDKFVALTRHVVGSITKLFQSEQILARSLFDIVQHDFYTFTHVTNVAAYALLLAEELGITDADELRRIAEGAMLHDIGKRFVPAEILCKPGRLTEEQRQLVQMHPARGYTDLLKDESLTHGQLMMVYQHHERVDGGGYPVRIPDAEIHPWAKMLAVVDVFDALTSIRPYRNSIRIDDALDMLERHAGSHFDKEMVRCWNSTIQKK